MTSSKNIPITSSKQELNAAYDIVSARSARDTRTTASDIAAEMSVEGPSLRALRRARHLLRQLHVQGRIRAGRSGVLNAIHYVI
jgi:hypothetical protein